MAQANNLQHHVLVRERLMDADAQDWGRRIPDETKAELVPVSYFQIRGNEDKTKDKVMYLKVLSIKYRGSVNVTNTKFMNQSQRNNRTNPKPYTYDRYVLLADLEDPNRCVAIICKDISESMKFYKRFHYGRMIGRDMYIFDAKLTSKIIGEDIAVIEVRQWSKVYVLKDEGCGSQKTRFGIPEAIGQTRYSVFENVLIAISNEVFPDNPSCAGVMCDRQRENCTCINRDLGEGFVYEFDVGFPGGEHGINRVVSYQFRSFLTTSLFFRDIDSFALRHGYFEESMMERVRREEFPRMINYINQHGGWKIVFWCTSGSRLDAAGVDEGNANRVQNETINYHISYLYPMTPDIILGNEDFKALQIATVVAEVNVGGN